RATAQGPETRHSSILLRSDLRRTRRAAPRTRTSDRRAVCLTVKPVGEPDAGNRHVRFDERGWETERRRMAQATAPILDSTEGGQIARVWACQFVPEPDSCTVERFQNARSMSTMCAGGDDDDADNRHLPFGSDTDEVEAVAQDA